MNIDVKAIRQQAEQEINKERTERAKTMLVRQMRALDAAREVVRAEELKLADLERQIQDGTLG